jgi:xanthine dehydrogenase accessory factor
MTRSDLLERAGHLRAQRTPFVLATVVRAERPTSAKAGDSALVLPDGTLDGFVGGTCAETTVRLQGLRLLETGQSTLLRITPAPEPAGDATEAPREGLVTVANPCLSGGTLEIFLEAMIPPPLVHVFGDAPVARSLAQVGAALGYHVVTTTDPGRQIPADAAAAVVASHGREEEPVLYAALRAGVPYVALVASRRRGTAVLSGMDIREDERGRVHSPAGLDIGAHTPAEVALSILAEIIATRPSSAAGRPEQSLAADPAGARGTTAAPGRASPGSAIAGPGPLAARDPVCGMAVAVTASALQHEHGGRTWYFCGPGCRAAFADAPDRYAA